jgi:hypothetical protein
MFLNLQSSLTAGVRIPQVEDHCAGKWIPWAGSPGVKRRCREAEHSPYNTEFE